MNHHARKPYGHDTTARLATACLFAAAMAYPASSFAQPCASRCADVDGNGLLDLDDYAAFADCLGAEPESSPFCMCSDLDGSGVIDLRDFILMQPVLHRASDETPPDCTGAIATPFSADLTAHRPQHRAGYAPFARTPVAEVDEDSDTLGPGIRVQQAADVDPAGEDDLIEVVVTVDPAGTPVVLRRDNPALQAWTTRDRANGTGIEFVDDASDVLPIGPQQTQLVVWVEWTGAPGELSSLHVAAPGSQTPRDSLRFHAFRSLVLALGGEGQVPTDPPEANSGTFVVAVDLYRAGYDVHMYDEDNVASGGAGAVYNEAVTAVRDRAVGELAIFGYSHGAGSTHDLSNLLNQNRAAIGTFTIVFTSYADAVANSSDVDTSQELRRPPSTLYHLNHYQVGSFFQDLGLDGGPVPDSNPPPTGLNVETTPWGSGSTHFTVDDYIQVRTRIITDLTARTQR